MSMYIPAGCTLTVTGPQVVEVGLGVHYGQSQGYAPAPVAHGTPMQVPGQAPYATPSATPGMVPTPMSVPGQVPYATPTPMDTPPPMLPHGTPALWPTPPMALTAPPQRPYDVPPPMLGNDKTPLPRPAASPALREGGFLPRLHGEESGPRDRAGRRRADGGRGPSADDGRGPRGDAQGRRAARGPVGR